MARGRGSCSWIVIRERIKAKGSRRKDGKQKSGDRGQESEEKPGARGWKCERVLRQITTYFRR